MTAPALLLDTADEVVRWLRREHPTVTSRNLRQWAKRGHITRHPGDQYDALEVVRYLEGRPEADQRRARRGGMLRRVTTSDTVTARDASPENGDHSRQGCDPDPTTR